MIYDVNVPRAANMSNPAAPRVLRVDDVAAFARLRPVVYYCLAGRLSAVIQEVFHPKEIAA